MSYLRNIWYFAALKSELDDQSLLARTIIEEPILFFTDETGVAHAIGDRCPHRFAPLHLGKHKGSSVECPYHGLQFDSSGQCVFNPHGDGKVAQGAKVKSYPLVERDSILWIWMGDPKRADPSKIPDYSFIGEADPAVRIVQVMHVDCNYELLTDNILDLTHADYLHPNVLGTGALSSKSSPRVWEEGDAVNIEWFVPNDLIVPGKNRAMPDPDAPLDSWISIRWEAPSCMLLESGVTPVGRPRDEGKKSMNMHVMTPEDEKHTHYFFIMTRDYLFSSEFNNALKETLRVAFVEQDKPMLEMQQKMMGTADFWSLKPVLLSGDVGAIRVRRKLEKQRQIEAEAAIDNTARP